jgi:hypothetical protein
MPIDHRTPLTCSSFQTVRRILCIKLKASDFVGFETILRDNRLREPLDMNHMTKILDHLEVSAAMSAELFARSGD